LSHPEKGREIETSRGLYIMWIEFKVNDLDSTQSFSKTKECLSRNSAETSNVVFTVFRNLNHKTAYSLIYTTGTFPAIVQAD